MCLLPLLLDKVGEGLDDVDDEENDAGGGAGRHHPLAEEEAGPDAGALRGNDQALTDHL